MKGEFYKMEYDAWDDGTDDLTLEQEAAYLRLCHQMYRHRAPVPNRLPRLARMWRCHQNKARKILEVLIEFGKIQETQDGHLTNTRVTQELDARETLSTQRADAGGRGGRRTADNRKKANDFNDPDVAGAETPKQQNQAEKRREEERREEKKREDGGGRKDQPTTPLADPEAEDFLEMMRAARTADPAALDVPPAAPPVDVVPDQKPEPAAPVPPKPVEEYAFIEGHVRVTHAHFERLKGIYPSINLMAELTNLAAWDKVRDAGKDWWGVVQGALLSRERKMAAEIRAARIKAEAEAKAGLKKSDKPRPAI